MLKVCILVVNNILDLKKGIGGEIIFFVGFVKFGWLYNRYGYNKYFININK